jgi:4-amino-4-deoxy-L-arabinose transferase-like glycosyltransferase
MLMPQSLSTGVSQDIMRWLISAGVFGLALVLLFYQLGGGSLYDWDEAIYAQAAKEMLYSRDWGTMTWDGYPFFHKPPLYFWLTALTYHVIGINELAARFWAALFGFGVVGLTFILGLRLRSWAVGTGAALLLLGVDHAYYSQWWNFLSLSRVGTMDTALTFWIMVALWLAWEAERRPWLLALIGLPVGLAILTKAWPGLFAVVIVVLYRVLATKTSARANGYWAVAGLLAVGLILPWHLWQYSRYGQPFLREYIGFNLVERAFQALEEHGGGPLFYLDVVRRGFSIWGYFWPLASLWALWKAWRWRNRGSVLLLCWMTLPLALFSLAQTKIGWYMNMVYPAVALLMAIALADALTDHVALGVVTAVMVACCIQLPAPADGSPDVKPFAPLAQQYIGPGATVQVIQPACSTSEPSLTAGKLLVTEKNIRAALVFYMSRPLTCIEERQALMGVDLHHAFVISDRRSWPRFNHLGQVVLEVVLDDEGYILARWN